MIRKKDTFLIQDRSSVKHLYIIITDPNEHGQVLVVNITSYKGTRIEDNSCLLKNGCHSFIKHDSVVNYSQTVCTTIEKIENAMKRFGERRIKKMQPISDHVLNAIQSGARISGRLKIKYRRFFSYF